MPLYVRVKKPESSWWWYSVLDTSAVHLFSEDSMTSLCGDSICRVDFRREVDVKKVRLCPRCKEAADA